MPASRYRGNINFNNDQGVVSILQVGGVSGSCIGHAMMAVELVYGQIRDGDAYGARNGEFYRNFVFHLTGKGNVPLRRDQVHEHGSHVLRCILHPENPKKYLSQGAHHINVRYRNCTDNGPNEDLRGKWWESGTNTCSSILLGRDRCIALLCDLWAMSRGSFVPGIGLRDQFNLLAIGGDNCLQFVKKVLAAHDLNLVSNSSLPHVATNEGLIDTKPQ